MPEREFTITELRRVGDSNFVDRPASATTKFTWTNDRRSAPRGSWQFGVELRTVREDYPGQDSPVEQVLGSNFREFSLAGAWDDRYNFPGFALTTMRAFEALVQRGSLCRFAFESVEVSGLLKSVEFDYKRASFIGYQFTVSPHFRKADAFELTVGRRAPETFKPVSEYVTESVALTAQLEAQFTTFFPAKQIKGPISSLHKGFLNNLRAAVADLISTVEQRIDTGADFFTDLKRLSNVLNVIKGQAAGLLFSIAALKSSTSLAWDTAEASLDFDTWRTSAATNARALMLLGHRGSVESARRVEPKAVALYRPKKLESLYSISQRFYGTPHAWQIIATRNGLTTFTLQGTELLIIPERS